MMERGVNVSGIGGFGFLCPFLISKLFSCGVPGGGGCAVDGNGGVVFAEVLGSTI